MADFGNRDINAASDRLPFEGAPTFSMKNRLKRALFRVIWSLLAAWTPPPLFKWRNMILRAFGARIHPTARIYSSVRIWLPENLVIGAQSGIGPRATIYNMAPITIGERVVISQGSHLCAGTHDFRDRKFQLFAKPIRVEDGVWIAAEAFVGPGVTLGRDCVLGARAVATKDLEENRVYAGNPAVPRGHRYEA